MNIITYLENQFTNIHTLLHDIVGDISEQEWLARAAPDQNRIGFIIWHIPRFQDNIVQTWIRGETEIFHRPEWTHLQSLRPFGVGTGISDEEADKLATMVGLAETLVYAEA